MSDLFEQTIKQINQITNSTSKNIERLFKKAVYKGEEYATKGKVQIEIEKLKWDLKQMFVELGKYVAFQHHKNGVLDFSHDDKYVRLLDKIRKQQQYITQRLKERDTGKDNNMLNSSDS